MNRLAIYSIRNQAGECLRSGPIKFDCIIKTCTGTAVTFKDDLPELEDNEELVLIIYPPITRGRG